MVGGEFGQAPVSASEAVYDVDSGKWLLINAQFSTASAMSVANQFMWIGEWMGGSSVFSKTFRHEDDREGAIIYQHVDKKQ